MEAGRAAGPVVGWLEGDAAPVLDAATAAGLRRALAAPDGPGPLLRTARHGSLILDTPAPGPRRRLLEFDRHGSLLAGLRWAGPALDEAWVRLPDRRWLRVEPRAGRLAPWGECDRLGLAERIGEATTALTVLEAVDWARPRRIPVLAEPARLPAGAGGAVLNLLAALAADAGVGRLTYPGPYPTEALFLALLDSFRYDATVGDPLAAFAAGTLAWLPAPHERLLAAGGACVHLRGRVEKVVWRGRAFERADVQGVRRHAPRRLRDVEGRVRGSLWALDTVIADLFAVSPDGQVTDLDEPGPAGGPGRRLPAAVGAGVGAVVAAGAAPALAPFVGPAAGALALEWGSVAGDLVEIRGATARLSDRLRARLAARLRESPAAGRAPLALIGLRELAVLLGDHLRGAAQALLAARPAAEQAAVLEAPPPPDPRLASLITDGVAALMEDALAGDPAG